MTTTELKAAWRQNYAGAAEQLARMSKVGGVLTAFNANIDAVAKLGGARIAELAAAAGVTAMPAAGGGREVRAPADVIRGLARCFRDGIAEEWLIDDEATFAWLREHVGYDRLQMGGQGGIVANAMAVCGVGRVMAHCASLPAEQARLFNPLPNLLSTDAAGTLRQASTIERPDPPMIHWILEFDGGETLTLGGETVRCPKSNRFIATYDPLNFRLHVDPGFAAAADATEHDVIILSGYHLLHRRLADGSSGLDRVDQSARRVRGWRRGDRALLHLELASTQDLLVRAHLLHGLAREVDSIGLNERELIDLLTPLYEPELARRCDADPSAANLFEAALKVFRATGCPRLQLHMYGLYLTFQKNNFRISPDATRAGMQLAAVVAAGKAGTGALDTPEALLWAKDAEVGDVSLRELLRLSHRLAVANDPKSLVTTGHWAGEDFDVIAVPTILVPNPVTLVGMGDTISSVSLVGAL